MRHSRSSGEYGLKGPPWSGEGGYKDCTRGGYMYALLWGGCGLYCVISRLLSLAHLWENKRKLDEGDKADIAKSPPPGKDGLSIFPFDRLVIILYEE